MTGTLNRKKRDWSRLRIVLLAGAFVIVWIGLWGRAYYVQAVLGLDLLRQAEGQYWTTESVHGERGEIFTRHGRVLAKSLVVKSVFARPEKIKDVPTTSQALASILDSSRSSIRKKLRREAGFVWIARKVGDKQAERIQAAHLPGIFLTEEAGRVYPQGSLAGQLIGFVGLDNQGLEGIELSFEDRLAGVRKQFLVQRDASGQLLYAPGQLRGELDGRDVRLTLDTRIQFAAEKALAEAATANKARHGMCLVIQVDSGDILAWAQYPFFNPNAFRKNEPRDWRNRIALDAFEPGSTMKPFLVASALEEGIVGPHTIYFCENGDWSFKGETFRDTHDYAWLPVTRIIRYSSNIGAAKIGLELGSKRYHHTLRRLGLGKKTGLPLPAEAEGVLRPPKWNPIDLVSASFGQGFSVTALQLAQAYLCLANKGLKIPLQLVEHPEQAAFEPQRIFSESKASRVLRMLEDVVQEDGTGTQARISGIKVGGKTGTAQKAGPEGGYVEKYVASFIGLFPSRDPEYLVVAVVDEPKKSHYGGVVAAPTVRKVGLELLAYADEFQGMELHQAKADRTPAAQTQEEQSGYSQVRADLNIELAASMDSGIPDLRGLPLRRALELLARRGIMPRIQGSGMVVEGQSPKPGGAWQQSDEWVIRLSEASSRR